MITCIRNWYKWREESLRRNQIVLNEKKLETSSLNPSAKVQHNSDGITRINLSSNSVKLSSQIPLELQLYPKAKENLDGGYLNKAFIAENELNLTNKFALVMKQTQQHVCQHQQQVATLNPTPMMKEKCNDLTLNEWDNFLANINPINSDWYEMKLISRICNVVRAPLLLAAILTVPVVDYDRRNNNWCRLLNSLHCITAPLVLTLATRIGSTENPSLFHLPLPVLVLVPGVIISALVLKTSGANEPPKYHPLFAYFGFIMSIFWVYLLATEIISLLKTVGMVFSMSDTAIGLGVLAWGNSLGDIVANISLADAGYPRMALGASIGAPLLNLLLGFGLSFTLSLKPGQSSSIEYSPTITLLCSTLALILISLMLSTLAPPEKSKKPFGCLLIGAYGVYFALDICLEYGLIKI